RAASLRAWRTSAASRGSLHPRIRACRTVAIARRIALLGVGACRWSPRRLAGADSHCLQERLVHASLNAPGPFEVRARKTHTICHEMSRAVVVSVHLDSQPGHQRRRAAVPADFGGIVDDHIHTRGVIGLDPDGIDIHATQDHSVKMIISENAR